MTNMEFAQDALDRGCDALGIQKSAKVVDIKKGYRWILAHTQDPAMPNFHLCMIKLERWIKAHMNVEYIELQLESLEDRNKRDIRSGRDIKMVNARNVEKLD